MNRPIAAACAVALAALALVRGPAAAQLTPFSVEPHVGFVAPVGATTTDALKTGMAAGGDVIFAVNPLVSVYGGYTWQRAGLTGTDTARVTYRGWDAGLRLTFSRVGPYTPFVRGGLVRRFGRLRTDGGRTSATEWGTGFHAGVGVELGVLGSRAALSPQVSFTNIQDAQWVAGEVGLHLRL